MNYLSADWSSIDVSVERVRDNTMEILSTLAELGSSATFFVLGVIARKHADLIRAIDGAGHEIACHGDEHDLVYNQTPAQFRDNLRKAADSLSSLTGKSIIGFRAPSSSITERCPWALDIIREQGFLYDSSIFPVKNYMYGVGGFPACPCAVTTQKGNRLIEMPTPAVRFLGLSVPFGGGVYLRLLPLRCINRLIRITHARGRSFALYFHPSDIDPVHMQIDLSLRESFFHNVGRRTARKKILSVLERYQWKSMGTALTPFLKSLVR